MGHPSDVQAYALRGVTCCLGNRCTSGGATDGEVGGPGCVEALEVPTADIRQTSAAAAINVF